MLRQACFLYEKLLTCGVTDGVVLNMTGNNIREIREDLGLTRKEFAESVRASVATIHRWEKAGPREVRLDPLHRDLVRALQHTRQQGGDLGEIGIAVAGALALGGGLFALYKLLEAVMAPRRRS